MASIRLVCWNQDLARERARLLHEAGISVDASPLGTSGLIGHFLQRSPSAVLIDLDRLPSHGREVAIVLRNSKSTRYIPIVFAGGLAEKVDRVRRELPDAVFTDWKKVATAVKKAMNRGPAEPVQPLAHMQRYARSSLVKKFGFKPGMKVAVLAAPDDFEEKLRELPEGVELQPKVTRATALAVWFVRSRRELGADLEYLIARLPERGGLWIVHPKQTGRYRMDFNQRDVMAAGFAAGLAGCKVCAVDADWSGLMFRRKKPAVR
jgi:CheY-like chemotaxis protein